MPLVRLLLTLAIAGCPVLAANAQSENVRYDLAKVIRAEPVYQTLRATGMVERCVASTPVETEERRGIARVVGAVKDVFTPQPEEVDRSAASECRMVPVQREFRRPIAYDVDYVHRGVKYRSRLPFDPGNHLRVRVSVTPDLVMPPPPGPPPPPTAGVPGR